MARKKKKTKKVCRSRKTGKVVKCGKTTKARRKQIVTRVKIKRRRRK